MLSETTSALAPGKLQSTCAVGGVMGGYMAIGNQRADSAPASVMTIDRTAAKIGRSMKKREITDGFRMVFSSFGFRRQKEKVAPGFSPLPCTQGRGAGGEGLVSLG